MWKKAGIIVVTVLLVAGFIVVGNSNAAEKVKLRVMTVWGGSQAEAMQTMFKEFNDTHPNIEVVHESVAGGGAGPYQEALQTGMASGTGPDVFFEWGGVLAGYFINAGHAEPLERYYDKYGWDKLIIDWAKKAVTHKGKVYGVPVSTHGMTFWYRVDLWKKIGLTEPKTYEEVEKLCEKTKAAGIYPLSLAGKYGWMVMRLLDYLLEVSAGPELRNKLNAMETSWDCPEVIKAFTLFKKWVDKEWIVPGFLAVNPDDARMPMYQGSALMVFEGSWMEGVFKGDGQDVNNFDFFIHPTDHTPARISGFPEQFMINAACKHKDEAAEFINWYIQPQQHQKYLGTAVNSTGTKGVMPDKKTLPSTYKWRNQLELLQGVYPPTDQVFEPELMHAWFEIQDGMAMGTFTPEQAAKKMQEAIDAWKAKQKK